MSDIRRRRKSNQSCGSDDLSDSYDELNATKETQSSEQTDGHQDSECDVYASDSDAESQEGALRESGDGQEEEKPQKKLDDDEDRRNPQYIPKRGTFYEHDDRTLDEIIDNNAELQNEREIKEKKVWKDKEDRWDHDRYNDEEQAPKSHEELIAVYGYDIRNEEGPPRARRRRRYGRGPNKYTRNWEDEDAYGKTGSNVSSNKSNNRKFNRSNEDFPALGVSKNTSVPVEEPVISSAWYSSKNKTVNKVQNFPPLHSQHDGQKTKSTGVSNVHTNENKAPNEPSNPNWKKDNKYANHNQNANGNNGPGGDADKSINTKISSRDVNKRNVQESVTASRARGRGFKANSNNNTVTNRAVESKPKGRGNGPITSENRRSNTMHHNEDQLVHDMKHVNIDGNQYHQNARHSKGYYAQSPNQQRPNAIPPRMQQHQQSHQQQQQQQQAQQQTGQQQQQQQQQDGSSNRPKRYSSLRQRPTIAESPAQQNYPPQHGQRAHPFFAPQAGNSRGILESQGYPQGHFEQPPQVAAPTAPIATQPVISLPPSGQPASYAPPPFLVPPPQFMPPQTAPPSIINYVSGPNGPAFQANFQGYQGYTPPVQAPGPPPPQELFPPQGCTYYSPAQQQQQQQQSAPIRRPKAAIPILPPPDNQSQCNKGRGRSIHQNQQNSQPGNVQSSEQESKINSVESDQNAVSGQFDNVEVAQTEDTYQSQKDKSPSSALNTENMEDKIVKDIGDVTIPTEAIAVTTDNVDGINVKESLEVIVDDKSTVLQKSAELNIEEPNNELTTIKTSVPETSIVEEAAA